ncbi:class 1 fructose-bisphosphatase [Idiomarina xiamenensis]|uniref:Fructose-1,6-bisphosphatase class 1 n=1 Tax=Idiomarina xiamenensis 10-D-4 TaxID=740709 RepID=K2KLH0_9GAMM|nr:class 1 fructose-bisphosphatase [Idiomarina xiamenensis]EKE87442.1 fructose-1,6-bisphosphatase [Idiomarina xiamenensis 10-D-4]
MQRLIPALRQQHVSEGLISVLHTLQTASKEISFRLHQGALAGVLGSTLDENIQGETQKKLDVLANQLLKDMLLDCPHVAAVASEEEDSYVVGAADGDYLVAFDPLDGSSNIDINGLVGTIFSVLKKPADSDAANMFLQPGDAQVAAGYMLYGPATMLVLTTGQGVDMYTLDQTVGEYLQTRSQIEIPAETSEFAINMSNQRHWQPAMQRYIGDLLAGKQGPCEKDYNMRWIAAMVGDVHRVLSRGGLFTYPWDARKTDKPYKLRLLYEANPMSFLVEQAGGLASDGEQRIMAIQPHDIHQRVGVILGSRSEVQRCLDYHQD